jgi:hypothetical protein
MDDSSSVISVESSVKYVEAAHDLKSLQSIYVNDNPIFQELKSHLEAYYDDRGRPKSALHLQNTAKWKSVVYNSLYNMLSEVVFTNHEHLRVKLLEKTKKWYYDKVGWPEQKP